jgi:hypothetical protein
MTTGHVLDAILGTWIFAMVMVWFIAEAIWLSGKLKRFFQGLFSYQAGPTNVDVTIQEMNTVRVERREGSDYRKSRHAIKGG